MAESLVTSPSIGSAPAEIPQASVDLGFINTSFGLLWINKNPYNVEYNTPIYIDLPKSGLQLVMGNTQVNYADDKFDFKIYDSSFHWSIAYYNGGLSGHRDTYLGYVSPSRIMLNHDYYKQGATSWSFGAGQIRLILFF